MAISPHVKVKITTITSEASLSNQIGLRASKFSHQNKQSLDGKFKQLDNYILGLQEPSQFSHERWGIELKILHDFFYPFQNFSGGGGG